MLIRILLVAVAIPSISGASGCDIPDQATASLKALFTYSNGRRENKPKEERFSAFWFRNRLFLRHNTPSPNTDTNLYPVFVYDAAGVNHALNCPSDATWVGCVVNWTDNPPRVERVVRGEEEPRRPIASKEKEHTCEFTLQIPAWAPSPDDERKRKIAGEILDEIRTYSRKEPSEVYVRDFNLNDPDILIYIIDSPTDDWLLGCTFTAKETPHCRWHMFGQSPRDVLRDDVMRRPYRLYPPPMGNFKRH
ncbi:MAG: hypothetical protein KIT09_36135 [Bryobacteraceae bacterium]|nr:hypothetical protein [Bryobacteraceae bacterium]